MTVGSWYLESVEHHTEATRLAKTYVWWQPPAETLNDPTKLLRQILRLGRAEDYLSAVELWGEPALYAALLHARPGEIDPKSERFWRLRFGLTRNEPAARS